jgi:hypothetical protein
MTLPSDSQQANHDAKVDGSTSPEYELLGRFEPRDRVLQKCGFKIIEKTKISPIAEAKTRKNTFFAWISIKQMNELA